VVLHQEDSKSKADNYLLLCTLTRKMDNTLIAKNYAWLAYELSEKLNYNDGTLSALYELARNYRLLEQFDSARHYTDAHIAAARKSKNTNHYSKGVYQKGILSLLHGETDTAIVYYRYALSGFTELNKTSYLFAAYNELGSVFQEIARYDSALVYFHKAMDLGEKNDFNGLSEVYCNIGKIHYTKVVAGKSTDSIQEYNLARGYLNKSLSYIHNHPSNHSKTEAIVYSNLGNISNAENQLDSALMYYALAESIYTELDIETGIYNSYINKGVVYRKQMKYDESEKFFLSAMTFYDDNKLTHGKIVARTNLATVKKMKKEFNEAISIYEECLLLTYESNDRKSRMNTYIQLSEIYKIKQNYENAYRYLGLYLQLKDSIYSIEKDKTIIELQEKYNIKETEAKYLTEKKANLEHELTLKRRTTYLLIAVGIVILLGILIIYHRNVHNKNKIIADQRIKQLEEEKKLLAARSIVVGQEQERKRIAKELHDGLGVLLSTAKMQFTTIKDKSPENSPLIEKAKNLLEQAAGDVRKISHNMMPGLLTRFGFYEAVEDLFEKLDDTPGLSAKAVISGNQDRLPENTEIMLYRIVQEMANNTLKHAGATEAMIDIVKLPNQLSIDYSDNGKGFDVDTIIAKQSIGLNSILSRVNFLSGNMDLQSNPGEGVNYHITIPIGSGEGYINNSKFQNKLL
jgi:signal transduction histidine kinase